MKKNFGINDIEKIIEEIFIPLLKKYKIFTFEGPLGAGKTTLVKALLKKSGVKEIVTSPTFNYLNTYRSSDGDAFNHFDLYRVNSLENFIENGFDEYLYSDNAYNLIEWPSVISELISSEELSPKVCKIKLSYDPDDLSVRIVEIEE